MIMCEECEECPNVRELLKIYTENWTHRVQYYFYKKYCSAIGHKFKDIKSMSIQYNGEYIIAQSCRCGKGRYVFASTRIPLTDEQMREYTGIIFWEYLNTESEIYKLLPKAPYGAKDE